MTPHEILEVAARGISHRHPDLFFAFLRRGYDLVRVSHADPRHDETALGAKLALGSLITALDDLADDPRRTDERALDRAIALVVAPSRLAAPESPLESLVVSLRDELLQRARALPGYHRFARLFAFDLGQVVHANSYQQLLTTMPSLGNAAEMRQYGPYNMGMIAAGMIDLMTVPGYDLARLGQDREAFFAGQRHGRISNMIHTQAREVLEGDVTSELLHPAVASSVAVLRAEQGGIRRRLEGAAGTSFDARAYAAGLLAFDRLHEELEPRL